MPIAYTEIHALLDNAEFQKRVKVALLREASQIVRQVSPVPAQLEWARAMLKNATFRVNEATIRTATVGAVFNNGDKVTDDQLQIVVGLIVPDLAASQ